LRRLISTVAALALATIVPVAAAGGASATQGTRATTVWVSGDGSNVSLSRSSVNEGHVAFKVSTTNQAGGSQITLFRLVGRTTLNQVRGAIADELNFTNPKVAAVGTRELNRYISAYGLADVLPGFPATVTTDLREGKYYLFDLGSFFNGPGGTPNPTFTSFTVRHDETWAGSTGGVATVWLTSADRFVGPSTLPADGSVMVRNVGDTIHFMSISPVKPGTTDKQIQEYYDSGVQAPPPFALNGPTVGLDVISPGNHATINYDLPKGTYVLQCFVADDVTGMPHAIMGMHKVVILK
jgi:hypothetical protein